MIPTVSIIVPVYNAHKYIKECVLSVVGQSYRHWELILIDDGSIDGSSELCETLSRTDSRIRLILKDNTGVSDTRNKGLEIASGKYVIFLDSDDYWCNTNILSEMVTLSEEYNLDVLRGEHMEVNSEGRYLRESRHKTNRLSFANKILDNYSFYKEIVHREFFSVLCLYKKHSIENVRFNTEKVFLEDAEFYLEVCLKELRYMYIPNVFYAYRKHLDSVSVKYVPNKFQNALNFTLLCFRKSNETSSESMYLEYIKDGLRNFMYDLQVLGEGEYTYQVLQELYSSHNIYCIHKRVKSVIIENNLYAYWGLLMPLNVVIYYFRLIIYLKLFLIRILKILSLYE